MEYEKYIHIYTKIYIPILSEYITQPHTCTKIYNFDPKIILNIVQYIFMYILLYISSLYIFELSTYASLMPKIFFMLHCTNP